MNESESSAKRRRYGVLAENRREAIRKLVAKYPLIQELYDEGPHRDGKGGWVNAIKDQRESAYRVLFYLNRLPMATEYEESEPYEVLYGAVSDSDQPNYPRVLYTTTGGVNLDPADIPTESFSVAVKTDSLEIVPVTFDRDVRTNALIESGYAYICVYDADIDALRILDLKHFSEIYMIKERQEVQVRTEEDIIAGDATFVRPFFLKYRVKRAGELSHDAKQAAARMLNEG
ncbi:MAG: hypothetical protein AAGG48_15815 [Planctomycetota bacterium]